jgi:hypothetical protein
MRYVSGGMSRQFVVFSLAASLWLLAPAPAFAQTAPADSPRELLKAIGTPLGSAQGASALASLATLEVSTAPLGTSTGGFTFTFDPQLRTWKRSASSFGPAFAERSLTTGRAKVSAGFNFLHAGYNSFNGQDLKNGEFRLAQNARGRALSYSALNLDLSSNTIVGYGHAGVTDDLDIGVAIPWITTSLQADGGLFSASGTQLASSSITETSSSGVGDIAIFGKYRFVRTENGGVALAVELRLPTGDKNQLRGLDVTRTLTSLIWSHGGKVSPHANAGYELWSEGVAISALGDVYVRNQFKYAAGVEVEASPRATVVVDLVGRFLRNGGKVGYQTFPGPGGTSIDALVGLPEGVHQMSLAPGVKWNAWRSVLITANVLASLKNDGLRANVIPVVGIDWAF